jgi:hypothetical protein
MFKNFLDGIIWFKKNLIVVICKTTTTMGNKVESTQNVKSSFGSKEFSMILGTILRQRYFSTPTAFSLGIGSEVIAQQQGRRRRTGYADGHRRRRYGRQHSTCPVIGIALFRFPELCLYFLGIDLFPFFRINANIFYYHYFDCIIFCIL